MGRSVLALTLAGVENEYTETIPKYLEVLFQ
jgi:hypothetical protein